MTYHAGIRDTKLEGDLASISCSAGDHSTLKKQSAHIEELDKKKENSDIFIAKLRLVVDVERKKQVTKLTNEVAEMRSAKEKVIEDFKSSKETEVLSETMIGGADECGTSLT
ncbi:hypothetical protein ACE6H2_026312 [Prunus campanulata]